MIAADLANYVTLGDLFIVAICLGGVVILWQRERKDYTLGLIQKLVDEVRASHEGHEKRLHHVEDAVIRLTALQETTDIRLKGVESRCERFLKLHLEGEDG